MIRVSKLTDYAVVVLTTMSGGHGTVHTAAALAERTGLPVPTVQKLLKLLARDQIVVSHRGATGGYSLDRAADEITVAEIIQAIDGPVSLTDCVGGTEGSCDVEHLCPMRGNWDRVNRAVRLALDGITLADMAPAFGLEIGGRPGAAATAAAN